MGFRKILGYRLGALFAGISIVCAIIIYTAPGLAHNILELLTHSTWQFTIQPFDAARIIISAIVWGIIGIIIGFAFTGLCDCIKDR